MEFSRIYVAHNLTEAYMIKNLLEGNGIECFMRDENMTSLYTVPFGGIRLEVRADDAEKAREILSEYTSQA